MKFHCWSFKICLNFCHRSIIRQPCYLTILSRYFQKKEIEAHVYKGYKQFDDNYTRHCIVYFDSSSKGVNMCGNRPARGRYWFIDLGSMWAPEHDSRSFQRSLTGLHNLLYVLTWALGFQRLFTGAKLSSFKYLYSMGFLCHSTFFTPSFSLPKNAKNLRTNSKHQHF